MKQLAAAMRMAGKPEGHSSCLWPGSRVGCSSVGLEKSCQQLVCCHFPCVLMTSLDMLCCAVLWCTVLLQVSHGLAVPALP